MPSRGPKQALVTIELFFHPHQDTRLPEFKAIEQLQADHPSRVRILYRVLKASSSSRLHYATLEAYAEGRFAAFLEELDKPSTSVNLTDAQLLQVATAAGMNDEQLAEVLATPPAEFDRVLDDNLRRFKQRFRNNQQGVLINGKFISRNDIDKPGELERVYDDEKEKALDLLDRGVEPRDLAAAFETEEAPIRCSSTCRPARPTTRLARSPAAGAGDAAARAARHAVVRADRRVRDHRGPVHSLGDDE